MAFQTEFDDADEVMSEINMTPLVDVMLVLLIIFIITMPVINQAVKLNLPQTSSQQLDAKPRHINISVDAGGTLYWDKQIIDRATLPERLNAASREMPQPELHLHADGKAAYENVAKFLAAAQLAGLGRIAFATQPER